MADRLFTMNQVAELLGHTPGNVAKWIHNGWLAVRRLPEGSLRVSESALIDFLKRQGVDVAAIMERVRGNGQETEGETVVEVAAPSESVPVAEPAPPPPPEGEADANRPNDVALDALSDTPPEPPELGELEPSGEDASPPPPPRPSPAPEAKQPPPPPGADAAAQVAGALLAGAIDREATEVHFDPGPGGLTLWMRIGGQLREQSSFRERLPAGLGPKLLAQLKALASIDPGAGGTRTGAFWQTIAGREISVSVSTCPTLHGERLVVRLADPRTFATLGGLGMPISDRDALRERLEAGGTMVLVVGTGRSAARRALRAMLHELADPACNVMTVERRVEDVIEGVCHTRADVLAGYSYPDAVRAFEAQSADAIAIGDLRDPESAVGAMEAAREGAVVVAAMAEPDTVSAVSTLLEMGLEPWPLSTTLSAVLECGDGSAPPRLVRVEGPIAAAIRAGAPEGIR